MKINKLSHLLAAGALLTSMLACNLGKSPAASEENPAATSAPGVEAPTNPPEVSKSACDNLLLPVKVGAVWNYKFTGSITDTFTRSILSVEADGFTDQDVFGTGVTRQSKWQCKNGDLIALNLDQGTSSTVSSENVTVDFHTTELSGVTLPAAIKAGDTWSQSMKVEGVEKIGDQEVPAKNHTTYNCTAIGVESITVEAGTFEAMRFDCQTEINVTITMQGNDVSQTLKLDSKNWYAPNVGLIKTTATGESLDNTFELTSYTIP